MTECPFCNAEVSPDARFCAICGKDISKKSFSDCPSCGIELISGKKFCHKCGIAVTEKIEEKHSSKEEKADKSDIPPEGNCTECGNLITLDKKFCAFCGCTISKILIIESSSKEYCPKCGNQVTPGKKFCAFCGYASTGTITMEVYSKVKCPECGNTIEAGKNFCLFCGCELNKIIIRKVSPEDYCPKCGNKIEPGEKSCSECEEETIIIKTIEEIIPAEEQALIPVISPEEVSPPSDEEAKEIKPEAKVIHQEDYCPKCGNKIEPGEKSCSECKEETIIIKTIEEVIPAEEQVLIPVISPEEVSPPSDEEAKEIKPEAKVIHQEDYCPKCGNKIEPGEKSCSECEEETIIIKTIEEVIPAEEQALIPVISPEEVSPPSDEEAKEIKPEAEVIPQEDYCSKCRNKIEPGEKYCSECEEETIIIKTIEEVIPAEEQVLIPVISPEKTSPPSLVKTTISPVSHEKGSVITEEKINKDSEQCLNNNKDVPQNKPSGKKIRQTYLLISSVFIFVVIVFLLIFNNAGKPSSELMATTGKTPSASVTVSNSPEPASTEISLSAPTGTPVSDLTETPVDETMKPSPTEQKNVVYNAVPTLIPTPFATSVPTIIVITYIQTPVPKKQPVNNVVFYNTPVPTQVDYYKVHRSYCDSTISNKVVPLYNAGKYQEALAECNNLIYRDKNYYMNYVWMAHCYMACKDTADAKYYIDMAWKLEYTETRVPYDSSESKKLYDTYRKLGGKN